MPGRPGLEKRIAAAVIFAALASALAALAVLWRTGNPACPDGQDCPSSTADAISQAIARGDEPKPLLDTFVASGAIRAATVYDRAGSILATSGTASPDVEQICRSFDRGSLCIEPAASASAMPRTLALALGAAFGVGALVALIAAWLARRQLSAMHDDVATVNQLLEQVQSRDVLLRRRASEVESANRDLESFASAVSHDLRAPLGSISGFAQALDDEYSATLDASGREYVYWIRESVRQMSALIDGLLQMSRFSRAEMHRAEVDLSAIAREIAASLQRAEPAREVAFAIPEGVTANGDERLLRAVLENLIGNAWKFTSKRPNARIELGVRYDEGHPAFYVRDNGAGFDPAHSAKMFRPFQRLHSEKEFGGTGIGLATVQKIVQRHGGKAWAEGEPDRGATVYFTTGAPHEMYA